MPNVEPNVGLELMTLRSRPELKSRAKHLTDWATQVPQDLLFFKYLFFKDIYLFMIDIERERKAETQEEGEAGSMPGARRGTRSRDSKTTPRAKGKRQTTEPPMDPLYDLSNAYLSVPWTTFHQQFLFPTLL